MSRLEVVANGGDWGGESGPAPMVNLYAEPVLTAATVTTEMPTVQDIGPNLYIQAVG